MSDEPNKEKDTGEKWVMPDPIFRSSDGHTPKTAALDPQKDVPTEPGFDGEDAEVNVIVSPSGISPSGEVSDSDSPAQSVHASTKTRVRHHKKKGGCAKALGLIAGAVALSAIAILIVLFYFLFYFRPTDQGTF